jgi:hypothetical protein
MTCKIWYLVHNTSTNEIMHSNQQLYAWQLAITARLNLANLILMESVLNYFFTKIKWKANNKATSSIGLETYAVQIYALWILFVSCAF